MANENARALRKRMTPQEVKLWVASASCGSKATIFAGKLPVQVRLTISSACVTASSSSSTEASTGSTRMPGATPSATAALPSGFRTLRFWSADVDGSLDSVVETVWHALQEPLT